jgi:hypothetical protein
LNGTNFIDWYRQPENYSQAREKGVCFLEQTYPNDPRNNATAEQCKAYEKHCNDSLYFSCLMLATMSSNPQK